MSSLAAMLGATIPPNEAMRAAGHSPGLSWLGRTGTPADGSLPLHADQVRRFRRQGFLSIPDFAPPEAFEDLARLRFIFDRLFAAHTGRKDGNYFDFAGAKTEEASCAAPQMLHMSKYAPELLDSPIVQQGWKVARQVLGERARMIVDHGLLKPAGSSAATPWHQDEAFWNERYHHDGLSIWIPLQDVDEHNGCMQFASGSHRSGVMPHQAINNDPRIHGLEVAGLHPPRVVTCPLKLGGATLHHARTLHYSAPNHSAADRRAYVLVFTGRVRRRIIPCERPWNHAKPAPRDDGASA